MPTTPPTAAEIDAYIQTTEPGNNYLNFAQLFGSSPLDPSGGSYAAAGQSMYSVTSDNVAWVVAYTDNASGQHFEGLGIYPSGVIGATDTELEASSAPVQSGGGPWQENGFAVFGGEVLPYLQWLIDSYGAITLRGYLLPAIAPWPPAPADAAVQGWVNNAANWPAAG